MRNVITAVAIIVTTAIMLNAQTDTVILQQDLDEYTGCKDKELRNEERNYFRGPEDRVLVISENCPSCSYARAALQFDLTSIPDNEEIISADLELLVGGYNGGGRVGNYALYRITREWDDEEANWTYAAADKPWTTPGGDHASEKIDEITVDQTEGFGWVSFNVLDAVKDFVANPDHNFGFLLTNSALSQEINVPSSDYEKPEWRPKMIIEHTVAEVNITRQRTGTAPLKRQVTCSTINQQLHIDNNSSYPVAVTVARLNGTVVVSEVLSGLVSKTLSVQSAGVYLISVAGRHFTLREKVSIF